MGICIQGVSELSEQISGSDIWEFSIEAIFGLVSDSQWFLKSSYFCNLTSILLNLRSTFPLRWLIQIGVIQIISVDVATFFWYTLGM